MSNDTDLDALYAVDAAFEAWWGSSNRDVSFPESKGVARAAVHAVAAGLQRDALRLDWLEHSLFEHKWSGTIGSPWSWHMAGPYRHVMHRMRGENLRAAIDSAISGKGADER